LQQIEKESFADTLLSEIALPNSVQLISGRPFNLKSSFAVMLSYHSAVSLMIAATDWRTGVLKTETDRYNCSSVAI
jgi:hypothetical protein